MRRSVKVRTKLASVAKNKIRMIIGGNALVSHGKKESEKVVLSTIMREAELNQELERFWRLEECTSATKYSREETQCEMEFQDAYRRDSFGRFIVPLLFRENPKQLGESRETAIKRLQSLHKRLEFKPELRAQYAACLQEYISLGHMIKVDEKVEPLSPFHYYHTMQS